MEFWGIVLFAGIWIAVNWEKGILWNIKMFGAMLLGCALGILLLMLLTILIY